MSNQFPHAFQNEARSPSLELPIKISEYHLWCALSSALGGGSNYWITGVEKVPCEGARYLADYPLLGGSLALRHGGAGEPCPHELTRERLVAGVALMATEYPLHFGDLVCDSGDATTGDVLLQLAVLGELVYA